MNHKSRMLIALILVQLVFFAARFIIAIDAGCQDLEFEVIASGDISGYTEETYLVIKNEAESVETWENHSARIVCPEHWIEFWENRTGSIPSTSEYSDINFSKKMVVCAFMGERRTAGYSITVGRIWVEDEQIHVEMINSSPSDKLVVAHVLTYPYIFVSVERKDVNVVFEVTEEDGSKVEYVLPEMPTPIFAFIALITFF